MRIDPVVQHTIGHQTLALDWHDIAPAAYSKSEQVRQFLREAGDFGLRSGISFPVQGQSSECAILSLATRDDHDRARARINEAMPSYDRARPDGHHPASPASGGARSGPIRVAHGARRRRGSPRGAPVCPSRSNARRTTMRIAVLLTALLVAGTAVAAEPPGLIKKTSPHGVSRTLDRLEGILEDKGITVALRWPHGERADAVDIRLRATEVIIFGNPNIGSHLMTSARTAGIDLPMKALAWRDADGQVWLGYNDPAYIAERHGIDHRSETLDKMANALDKLTDKAVAAD